MNPCVTDFTVSSIEFVFVSTSTAAPTVLLWISNFPLSPNPYPESAAV